MPILDANGAQRGVVLKVRSGRWAGRFRIFRYQLRRFIPDVGEVVDSR